MCKPSDMKDKNFQLSINDKCDRKQKRIDGKNVHSIISSKMNVKVYITKLSLLMKFSVMMMNKFNHYFCRNCCPNVRCPLFHYECLSPCHCGIVTSC